ncbi:MAG: SMP-30/gluconolactonase/LRE family protein [Vulcanimicrobiaceae bacterium]
MWLLAAAAAAIGTAGAAAQTTVVALDPSFAAVIAPDATLEVMYAGTGSFFEGPTWVRSAAGEYLIFTDIEGNTINRLDGDGKASPLVRSIFSDTDRSQIPVLKLPERDVPMVGADGTTLDRDGRIVFAGYGTREVTRVEKDGRRTVLATGYGGKRFNTPNDLVYRSNGTLYFTDSSADTLRKDGDPLQGVSHSGVYTLKDGHVGLLIDDFVVPNGLAFSPDEKYLYVNDSRKKTIWRYEVRPDDTLTHGVLFADLSGRPEVGVPDGMKVDTLGDVYSTGPGGIWVFSPTGTHIGTILAPGKLTNLGFGGHDGTTLYVTEPTHVYRIALKIKGIGPD